MSQPNGFSPSFPGPVSAQSFQSTLVPINGTITDGTGLRYIPQKIFIHTNGTTGVNVFGTTNGISGTFLGAKVISKDDASANITLKHTAAGTTLWTVIKGSEGSVKGTFPGATQGVAFASTGTATVQSSAAAGNAIVEIEFIASNPALPGYQ